MKNTIQLETIALSSNLVVYTNIIMIIHHYLYRLLVTIQLHFLHGIIVLDVIQKAGTSKWGFWGWKEWHS